ncbi:MAG TPA: hypothetical protein VFQ85_03495 [Mycobacteriales bacterium]|jgi:hypothetical protein|nr:hypothetical protein [Mycobacteriales bacterium]
MHAVTRLVLAASVVAALLPAAPALAYCENNETNPCGPSECDKRAALVRKLTGLDLIECPQG